MGGGATNDSWTHATAGAPSSLGYPPQSYGYAQPAAQVGGYGDYLYGDATADWCNSNPYYAAAALQQYQPYAGPAIATQPSPGPYPAGGLGGIASAYRYPYPHTYANLPGLSSALQGAAQAASTTAPSLGASHAAAGGDAEELAKRELTEAAKAVEDLALGLAASRPSLGDPASDGTCEAIYDGAQVSAASSSRLLDADRACVHPYRPWPGPPSSCSRRPPGRRQNGAARARTAGHTTRTRSGRKASCQQRGSWWRPHST